MCLHTRNDDEASPKPRNVMRLGMLLLAVALVAQRFIHPAHGIPEDAADAIRGLLIGLSIGLNLWAVRMAARRGGWCVREE